MRLLSINELNKVKGGVVATSSGTTPGVMEKLNLPRLGFVDRQSGAMYLGVSKIQNISRI
jgi:hypothetical protein